MMCVCSSVLSSYTFFRPKSLRPMLFTVKCKEHIVTNIKYSMVRKTGRYGIHKHLKIFILSPEPNELYNKIKEAFH